jgi:hypothetical protein
MIKPARPPGRRTVPMPPAQHNPPACGTGVGRSRRSRAAHLGLLAGLLALSTAAACGGADVHKQAGPLRSASARPSPTAALTARQRAIAAATAQVNRYERLLDKLGSHQRLPLDRLYTVATEPEVLSQIAFFNHFRSHRDRQSGGVRVISITVRRVSLANRQNARPTIDVTACLDVAQVKAFGPDGHSIVPEGRKPYYLTRLRLVSVKYPDPSSWLVAKVSATEEQHSCAS